MRKKWRALDLFCGVGGAAVGLKMAGFDEVVGMDINPQPDYPFDFVQCDVIKYFPDFFPFDFIWASPPCQAYSLLTFRNKTMKETYGDLMEPTRARLEVTGLPYCIENVPLAPMRQDIVLTGAMFGMRILRRRWFECKGFYSLTPTQKQTTCEVTVISGAGFGKGPKNIRDAQEAMQIFWTDNLQSLAEAVPPKYSEYIGKAFLRSRNAI